MTKGSVVYTRLAIGSIAVGALAIIVGNSQIAMGRSSPLGYSPLGYTVRYVGLCTCTLTAIVFLFVRIEARRRLRAQHPQPIPLPPELIKGTGPSQMLVASIRVFCVLLFMLASYFLIFSSRELIRVALGQFRFSGVQAGYAITYMLLNAAVLLVPVLVWFMTNVILRMSAQLDEVSGKVAELQQRTNQMMQTRDPMDSSK